MEKEKDRVPDAVKRRRLFNLDFQESCGSNLISALFCSVGVPGRIGLPAQMRLIETVIEAREARVLVARGALISDQSLAR